MKIYYSLETRASRILRYSFNSILQVALHHPLAKHIEVNISGEKPPTSIKLEPVFFTKSDRERFEAIESKTKAEILEKIQLFRLDELEFLVPDVLEVMNPTRFPSGFKLQMKYFRC